MSRTRENPEKVLTPAEKQARHRQKKESEAQSLQTALWELQAAVWDAADRGDAVADRVKASNHFTLIKNLTAHFKASGGKDAGG